MLQDKQATGCQYRPLANGSDDFLYNGVAIGRIGENDIHRAGMGGKVIETPNGICQPDPALYLPIIQTMLAMPTMLAKLTMLATKATAVQVVPDYPDGTPVVVDKKTASSAPTQGFNAQASTAGTQVQHRAVDDSGRQDIEQRTAYAAAGGTNRPGYRP